MQATMTATKSIPVRALLLGERLETRGLERDDTIWTTPLTLRVGEDRIAVLFRYGVAVFAGMSDPGGIDGNLSTDPMFIDADHLDFHLQHGSPCIDAGDPAVADRDSSRADMGVFGGPGAP